MNQSIYSCVLGILALVGVAHCLVSSPQQQKLKSSSHLYPFRLHASTTVEIPTSATKSAVLSEKSILKEGSSVEFPAQLSKIERLKRSAAFWGTAGPIIANYYGLISKVKFQELLGSSLSEDEIEEMWEAQHKDGATKLADIITKLGGYYCKTSQIISSRKDLFPEAYTDALSGFFDEVDPMPLPLVKAVIESELLNQDEAFEDVFAEFDAEPLGSASIAQCHRAVLTEKYGGKEVAVKVQRPSIESKLLGDIANLKAIAKLFRDSPALPLDYYTVFSEIEKQMADEFDFVAEAVAMDRIYQGLIMAPDGTKRELPLVLPRPVPGLVCRRVLVMDFLRGVPLSRAREEMIKKGIDPDSPEAKLFGRKILTSLTTVFGRSILETGFFHADPHPGNIFVLEDGNIGLIDFGQVKQISGRSRETLCKVMIAIAGRHGDGTSEELNEIGKLALELGVEFRENCGKEAPPAVAMWLFDGSVERLPGGYDKGELSPNSPVKELKSFPQDLVLVGRSSILIKGLSDRLGIPWSLAKEWAPIAKSVLENSYRSTAATDTDIRRVRFREVGQILKQWAKGRATTVVRSLPAPLRSRVASYLVAREERLSRKRLATK